MKKTIDKTKLKKTDGQAFLATMQTALNAQAAQLDKITQSRLRQAREQALRVFQETREKQSPFYLRYSYSIPMAAVASLLIFVLMFPLFNSVSDNRLPIVNGEVVLGDEALDLLASGDSMEFYSELEFYEWLTVKENAG